MSTVIELKRFAYNKTERMDAITRVHKIRFVIVMIVLLGGTALYKGFAIYSDLQQTVEDVYTPLRADESSRVEVREPYSVLLLGVDERGEDAGRSDTMVVLTVNPVLQTTKMLSIPRDTRVAIVGENFDDKINHAYAFGGTQMAVATVEQFLQLPIHYVVKVNMESFAELVDLVGGISVDNAFSFYYEGVDFPAGELVLNGEHTLKYVRMRFEDPNGDFGRQQRQRQVLEGLVEKGLSIKTILYYEDFLQLMKNQLEMNLTMADLKKIQKHDATSLQHIETLSFYKGRSERIGGIYYYIPDAEELTMLQQVLQSHLQLSQS